MLVAFVSVVAALAAPATVLEHDVDVTIDARRQLTETVTVSIRVDDVAACAAGVFVPPGLDGASDSGAMVLEDVLIVPPDAQQGDVFTLSVRRSGGRGAHSGVMRSAPDLPVQSATLDVTAPASLPLSVWADPGAHPTYAISRSQRKVSMRWEGALDQAPAAAWSTYGSWDEASAEVLKAIDGKMASKQDLGRDVAADLEGLGVAGITERAFERVQLEAGPPGTWAEARKATEISEARSGTAAERGVVLISLLRIAGFDALPGQFRPAGGDVDFPSTVPAPALLTRPMVVVNTSRGVVYVDPAAERASVPDRPASLLGATVWVPGQLPFALPDTGVVDGQVTISTAVTIAGDGSATWSSSVSSSGAATEYLRQLLGPLDDAGRKEALGRLVAQGRPGIERLEVQTSGVTRTDQPLTLTVSGFDAAVLQSVGFGLRGTVPPTLGPAMAGWLPSNLAVRESVSIAPPPALSLLGSRVEPSTFQPEAMVSRRYTREGPKATLDVEVQRPYRRSTPGQDKAARSFLAEQAALGAELMLFTAADKATLNGLMASDALTDPEKVVLSAQLWWSVGNDKKARKALKKGVLTIGFDALLTGLSRVAQPGEERPWDALLELAAEQPAQQVAVAEAMAEAGLFRRAWLASAVHQADADASVALTALLLAERLQGPQPEAEDAEALALWKEPSELLARAAELAPNDPRVRIRQAELALAVGETAKAESLVDELVDSKEAGGAAMALGALAAAQSGIPKDEVTERIQAAVREDPTNPEVIGLAARATAEVGAVDEALEYALSAARIGGDDPQLWETAADRALAASSLGTAVYASRLASDLDPANKRRARRLASLALLAADRELYDLGVQRAGDEPTAEWPPSVDARMRVAPGEALLGLLDVAEDDVAAEPRLLAMRSQLRIEAGRLDEGARDGMYLAGKYQWAEGWALAYAGTVGRQYSSFLQDRLDEAARSQATAQAVRMEVGLIAGSSDPMRDASSLGDARANALQGAVRDPAAAAAAVQGWPTGLVDPKGAVPSGYKLNRPLGSADGVVAYSNASAQVGMLRVGQITGLLPPPLSALYSVDPQPIERLDNGGQVVRLVGGVVPLYAAIAFQGEEEVYGLGFSTEAAKQALADALR